MASCRGMAVVKISPVLSQALAVRCMRLCGHQPPDIPLRPAMVEPLPPSCWKQCCMDIGTVSCHWCFSCLRACLVTLWCHRLAWYRGIRDDWVKAAPFAIPVSTFSWLCAGVTCALRIASPVCWLSSMSQTYCSEAHCRRRQLSVPLFWQVFSGALARSPLHRAVCSGEPAVAPVASFAGDVHF